MAVTQTGVRCATTGQQRGRVQVTMCYYGTSVHLDCERTDRRDEVVVQQQHCGGNAPVVYSGKLLPGGEIWLRIKTFRNSAQ